MIIVICIIVYIICCVLEEQESRHEEELRELRQIRKEIANANSSVIIVKSVYADNAQFVTKLVNR